MDHTGQFRENGADLGPLFSGHPRPQHADETRELTAKIAEPFKQGLEGERVLRHGPVSAGDCVCDGHIRVAAETGDGCLELTVRQMWSSFGQLGPPVAIGDAGDERRMLCWECIDVFEHFRLKPQDRELGLARRLADTQRSLSLVPRREGPDGQTVRALDDVDLVFEEKRLQAIQVLMDLGELGEPRVIEPLECDAGFGQFPLGHFDVTKRLGQEQNLGVFVGREVSPKAVLLVLLLQSLERAQSLVDPHQHSLKTGLFGRPPALLAADDLVVSRLVRHRFDLKQRVVAARPHRLGQLRHQVHGDRRAWLQGRGMDVLNRYQCQAGREGLITHEPRPTGRMASCRPLFVFSWSAGKDSAFGLWTLLRDPAYEVRALLTTITETFDRVSMSGVREELLDRQADVLGLPVIKVRIPPKCSNDLYEQRMASTLAAEEFQGIDHVAFADLFLEDVRAYREERLARVGKHAVFPLWGRDTRELAEEMVETGFRALVVCVDPQAIDPSSAGRAFDRRFLADLPPEVDPCGENGEFHTFVWDAPMYRQSIACRTGDVVTRDGFVYCDVLAA